MSEDKIPLVIGIAHIDRPIAFQVQIAGESLSYPNMNRQSAIAWNQPVDKARIDLVKYAKSQGASWLFFRDDDVEFPRYAIRKLMYDLENAPDDVMVAGGIYCTKTDPPEPVVYKDGKPFWKWKVKEVFSVDAVGAGCMLINMKVFEHLEEPWFKRVDEIRDGIPVFIDDDRWFCQKVLDSGFRIYADGGVLCAHWDAMANGGKGKRYVLPPDSYPFRGMQPKVVTPDKVMEVTV